MDAGVEDDDTARVRDNVEEPRLIDLAAHLGIEGVEDRQVGTVAAAMEREEARLLAHRRPPAVMLRPPGRHLQGARAGPA
jgi:hypothetical protein